MPNLDSVIQQLRDERDRLDQAIATLEGIADHTATRPRGTPGGRRFTAAAILKMRASQRVRRARERANKGVGSKATLKKSRGRRHLSPQGLARIRAAQRKRWAKVKAGKKK
jgi:hypothetical protein